MKTAYDAIVLGGGMAGLCVARELTKRGRSVLLLERETKGGGTSRAAAGILDPYTEADQDTPLLRLGTAALDFYPGFLQELGTGTAEKVEYEKLGVLYLAFTEEDERFLKRRFEWQKGRGIPVAWLSPEEVRAREPGVSPRTRSGVFYSEVPKLNADKLTEAVWKAVEKSGVEIVSSTAEVSVWTEGDRVRGVRFSGGEIESPVVVQARGTGEEKVRPVRGQILILRTRPGLEPRHVLHTVRYAYMVPWPRHQVLVGSTLERDVTEKKVTAEGQEDILTRAGEIFEKVRELPVETSWAGLRPQALRELPLIGPTQTRGLFVATGYYRSGILIAPLAGKFLAEAILTKKISPLIEPFDPEKGGLS